MKWFVAIPLLMVFGTGFWVLLDIYCAVEKVPFSWFDTKMLLGMGIWMLAVFSGTVIEKWR